jgi:hypothetical protein
VNRGGKNARGTMKEKGFKSNKKREEGVEENADRV